MLEASVAEMNAPVAAFEEAAIQALLEAGEILRKGFVEEKRATRKGKRDLVTSADLDAEDRIVTVINDRYPDHSIVTEEGSSIQKGSMYQWIVDPLDGTINYFSQIPFFCVSIGLVYGNELILGSIYDPLRDDLFLAKKGAGATCNGKSLAVSSKHSLEESVVSLDLGYADQEAALSLQIAAKLRPLVRDIRVLGSAALSLAYLASGTFDIMLHSGFKPWDLAAGDILVREAGGRITDFSGQPSQLNSPRLVAANVHLHSMLLPIVKAASGIE